MRAAPARGPRTFGLVFRGGLGLGADQGITHAERFLAHGACCVHPACTPMHAAACMQQHARLCMRATEIGSRAHLDSGEGCFQLHHAADVISVLVGDDDQVQLLPAPAWCAKTRGSSDHSVRSTRVRGAPSLLCAPPCPQTPEPHMRRPQPTAPFRESSDHPC